MQVVTHEDYLVAVATAVCEQFPATAASLSEVQLVFGTGPRRRALAIRQRVWNGGESGHAAAAGGDRGDRRSGGRRRPATWCCTSWRTSWRRDSVMAEYGR